MVSATIVMTALPLPHLVLLPVISIMTYVMYLQIFYTRRLARAFWIDTYLRPDGPVYSWVVKATLIRWLSLATAAPLAVLTYIIIYSYDIVECVAVAAAIASATLIHCWLSKPLDRNITQKLAELARVRIFYCIAILCVLTGLAVASLAKGLFRDHSQLTSSDIADMTIADVKHPVLFVRHFARTLRYSELRLLKIRDLNGWPYGWAIYLFFLVPNAVPALGLVTLYCGCERLLGNDGDLP